MSNRVNKFPDLIDGVAMSIMSSTFEVPSEEYIASIEPGVFVKVGAKQTKDPGDYSAERFWCEVLEKKGENFIGRINNDLVLSHLHRLYDKDIILIEPQNILSIYNDR